jgi:hypothetical protein
MVNCSLKKATPILVAFGQTHQPMELENLMDSLQRLAPGETPKRGRP